MSVTIEIFDERSIGRYYQLAALGAIYDELTKGWPGLASKLLGGLRTGTLTISTGDLDVLAKTLTDFLQTYVCAEKDRVRVHPRLYRAGPGDQKILRGIGIQEFTCESLVRYYGSGSLLKKCSESANIPMFLRTYVFSSYRDAEKVKNTNVASLFIALAGVHISMVGRARKGEELYEVYLVPDASVDSIVVSAHKVYKLIYAIGAKARPWSYIADFAKLEGLSYELAVLLSMMLYLYEAMTIAQKLESVHWYEGVFERFKLVNVSPGGAQGRPIVLWERPLAVSHVLTLLERRRAIRLLRLLHSCSMDALELRERVERIADVASSCVSDVFSFLESGSLDPLLHCAGSAARVADELEGLCRREPETIACDARKRYYELSEVLALLAR